MEFITILDYLLLPFYLLIIFTVAIFIRNRRYPPGHPWRPYFIPGLTAKIFGALAIGMIYQYYYGGGDTTLYWWHAHVLNGALDKDPGKWFDLLFHIPPWWDGAYSDYIKSDGLFWYDSASEYTVCQITTVLGLVTFTTYLPISILFASLAYTGIWSMFKTFATLYPKYTKYIAWCVLFIPSTVMWGSGIFKDTVCMFGLGWLTYGAFRMLLSRDRSPRVIIMTIIAFYLIAVIKIYILLAFIPALALWILFTYSHRIRSSATRLVLKVVVVGVSLVGFTFFSKKFAADLGKYSVENLAKTSYVTSTYIRGASGDAGSAYNLGDIEPTTMGMLKKFIPAVNVTLFRPYIWETRKVMQLLNAVEALLFLWVTIKILISVGPKRTWRTIVSDPTIQFCLIFTLIFAFAVGISSGNFGALSRYRIPCLPFYGIALVLIYYRNQPIQKNILSLKL